MVKINPALLRRLEEKLGICTRSVYRKIQNANSYSLEDNLAALSFARENGVNIKRYSTAEERDALRAALPGSSQAALVAPAAQVSSAVRTGRRPSPAFRRKPRNDGTVFVVHGRNENLRKSLFDFLRCIDLNPIEWEKAVLEAKGGNPYVGDVLRTAMEGAHVIVVLLSPDDEAKLKDGFCKRDEKRTEGKLQGQPRPNVLFEAGWAVGAFPKKTLLVQVGKLKGFTDIGGRHMLHLNNEAAKRTAFANRLRKFGCKVSLEGSDWVTTGDFKVQ